ncbi:hypothetical protein Pmani_025202 [Petrolisthes manimaculis]|uniref:Uncharacterized protein n=1 Tax=Petrolisthes manimaculis TaxID=1843537 RepID=A0AAE1P880_9EUCA|nr:hypothetical protein Pmani_025202 [Petrolisthes manimaculis]
MNSVENYHGDAPVLEHSHNKKEGLLLSVVDNIIGYDYDPPSTLPLKIITPDLSSKEVDDNMKATSDWKNIKCLRYVGGEMTATFYLASQDHYPRSLFKGS